MEQDLFEQIKTASLKTIKQTFLDEKKKAKDQLGAYLSFYAAKRGRSEIFDYIFQKNVPIRGSDREKNTILFYAMKGNNLHIIEQILTKNIKLNQLNKYGAGAVLYINKKTKVEIIEFLITKGLDINKKFDVLFDRKTLCQRNLLFYTLKYNHFSLIKFLVQKKVNFSTSLLCDGRKYKMFYFMLYYGHIKTIQFFIEQGIKTKLSKKDIKELVGYSIEKGRLDVLKIIIQIYPDIMEFYYGENERYSTFTYAVHLNQVKIVRFFMKQYPSLLLTDSYYYRPIHYAIENGNLELFNLLKEDGEINAIINPSLSTLELACDCSMEDSHKAMIKEIIANHHLEHFFEFSFENVLDFGEEISLVSNFLNHLNPLMELGLPLQMIKTLVKKGVKCVEVHLLIAIYKQNLPLIKYILKTSKDINLFTENQTQEEHIFSFMMLQLQKVRHLNKKNKKDFLEILHLSIEHTYYIYYVLQHDYPEEFLMLDATLKQHVPDFQLKATLFEEECIDHCVDRFFILDFGERLFKVSYDIKKTCFQYVDNHGTLYKNLPKPSKKDDAKKARLAILFFNKYKWMLCEA